MSRYLLITAAFLLLPATSYSQSRTVRGGFGGGALPGRSVLPTVGPIMPGVNPGIGPVTGGGIGVRPIFHPGRAGWWNGHGGWFPWYGYAAPIYSFPVPVEVPVPVFVPVQPPEPPLPISGEAVATLVLQFPASAEVWLNGKKSDEPPGDLWTLTSPSLPTGAEYTFVVKARWSLNGKTYEYDRTVAVAAGNRSRATVLSGTEIKE